MTQLSSFSDDDRELIVALPYRVGMHMSYAEDEDGERDDELEIRALKSCISEVAKLENRQDLIKQISAEILSRQDSWDAWSQGVFNIVPQCEKAVDIMKAHANDDEFEDYIKMVLEVASAVARAYGEFGEEPEAEKGFFGKAMSKIMGGYSGMSSDDINHPMNVSAAEDSAIAAISAALKGNS